MLQPCSTLFVQVPLACARRPCLDKAGNVHTQGGLLYGYQVQEHDLDVERATRGVLTCTTGRPTYHWGQACAGRALVLPRAHLLLNGWINGAETLGLTVPWHRLSTKSSGLIWSLELLASPAGFYG